MRLNEIKATSGAATASQARAILSAFFVWSIKEGIADANPVLGTNNPQVKDRNRVLTDDELKRIWNGCRDDAFGRIIKLLMLTGCRRNEIAKLRWGEIDLNGGLINLPEERVKNKHAHSLPITPLAAQILESIPRQANRDFLFGHRTDGGWTGFYHAQRLLDARIQIDEWIPHDIRRSVATGMAELGILPHVVEAVLNHRTSKAGVAGIYNKSTYPKEVRSALLVWNDHIASIISGSDAKVVVLKTA